MNTVRIYISLPQDRDAAVTILAKNGYTVRQGKEKRGKTYDKFVEFWKEGEVSDSYVRNSGTNCSDKVDTAAVHPGAVSGDEVSVPYSK